MSRAEAQRSGEGEVGLRLDTLLAHIAERGAPLALGAVGHVGRQVARALAEAHGALDAEGNPAPVLHGQVRPRAVRVGRDGAVTLDDPGAPLVEGADPFRAPEVGAEGRATPRADVFALGALVRALLATGAAGAREGVPAEIEAALARALEAAPARRRITCVELEEWLATLGDHEAGRREIAGWVEAALAPKAPPPAPPKASTAIESRRLSPLGSALVAGLTAAAVIAVGELAIRLARP